jgi:hypothetical protein
MYTRCLSLMQQQSKFTGPKVDIYVGVNSKHFNLPKDILCYYSSYFERCFNGRFEEGEEQKLTLPEDKLDYFQILLDYMFLGSSTIPKLKSEQFSTWRVLELQLRGTQFSLENRRSVFLMNISVEFLL